MPTFAGYQFTEESIPLASILPSDTQPRNRDDLSDPKRQALLRSMAKNGLKDPIDVELLPSGMYSIIEGHGRYTCALFLEGPDSLFDWSRIRAKVYRVSPEESPRLRSVIMEAEAAKKKMNGQQAAEFIYRNRLLKNDVSEAEEANPKAARLVDFLLDPKRFTEQQAERLLIKLQASPETLSVASMHVRRRLGFGERGVLPESPEAQGLLRRTFVWLAEYGMVGPVKEHYSNSESGWRKVQESIDNDKPMARSRKAKEIEARRAEREARRLDDILDTDDDTAALN
jgi:hypothetical protein